MNKTICFIALALFAQCSLGQKKQLTIEDAMINARTSLAPETMKQLQFVKGTKDFVYLKKIDGIDTWMRSNYSASKATPFLTLPQLNQKLSAAEFDTAISMPAAQFNGNNIAFTLKGQKINLDISTGKIKVLIDKTTLSKENVEESAGGYIAFVDNKNLFVSKDGNAQKVTNDGSEDIVYASTVHQSEFGITKGTFWSNSGNLLAFYRMDQSMTPNYPIVDWSERPAKVENLRYPMAGDSSHHVKVGIYDAIQNKTIWVKTSGPEEQFLTNIAWTPDDQSIIIVVVNREQNHFWVNQYNAATGDYIKTLFEEEDSNYAEPLVPALFVPNHPEWFVWQSKRNGFNHLYLYDRDGNLVKQLTTGTWDVTEVKGFDAKGENLFFSSTFISAISKNLMSVQLNTGKIKFLTSSNEVHNTQLSSDGTYVLDNYASPQNPRTIKIIDTKTGKSKILLEAANPLSAYDLGEMNIFTIKNSEGIDLYCRMFKPVNFDSTKKYPVVVYWYGGPHAQMILNGWNGGAGDYWFQYMAERGYIVFTLDTRGSSNRGKAFEQAIFRNAGEKQMEDLMSGVTFLNKLNYVDKNNMGLFGWSYGGFMTIDFMLNHPGIFKAAVAGGPVTDWKFYEIMYTERYMDRPQENPEGYEQTNLVKQIGNLKGKLLLIHGMQDNVVVMQHSVNLVKAAVDKGVQVDYMIYPGHEHNVLGKDRAHLYQKVTDYLTQYLK